MMMMMNCMKYCTNYWELGFDQAKGDFNTYLTT